MSRRIHKGFRLCLGMAMVALLCSQAMAIFSSKGTRRLRAIATTTQSTAPLSITAAPLEPLVFAGKHFLIPVKITSPSPIDTNNLRVDVAYQIYDQNGNALSAITTSSTTFQIDSSSPTRIFATAYVPRSEFSRIFDGGQLKYFFRVLQNGGGVYLGGGTGNRSIPYPVGLGGVEALNAAIVNAYTAKVVTSYDLSVTPAGSSVFVPDTFETDGRTGMHLDPNAVTNPGVLHIEQLNTARIPSGPGSTRPTVAYNFSLIGTSLQKTGQIILTYPADLSGQIADNGGNPLSLAPYWWDGVQWRLLSRPKIDTTLHTVTGYLPPPANGSTGKAVIPPNTGSSAPTSFGVSTQFEGSFALFPAQGAATASALRPAERIITPNGDGINDVANFSGLVDGDSVHIFDVRGRRVRTIRASNLSPTQWDGRNDNGGIVASGVYVYQYTSQGEMTSGVIAVAK